ncbi:MAG: cytidine deaminase [Thermoproteota archaeon]|nr:cytidine deaminase [Thermoproteota archaeon]
MNKIKSLFLAAEDAIKNSYSPYSKFSVGASLLSNDGRIFRGTNVENISYGLSICAERVAIFNAISNGCRDFTDIAIVTTSGKSTFPCGACRQVLVEFSPNLKIHLKGNRIRTVKLSKIYPNGFNSNQMTN